MNVPESAAAVRLTAGAGFSLEEKLLVGFAAYFVALKLVFSVLAWPIVDESYYWLWGRHPAIGYFDHPPLIGWLNGIFHALFGRSNFVLRLPALLAVAGTAFLIFKVAVRIGGERSRLVFLRGLAVYLASPLFGFFLSVTFNDYLLVLLVMGAAYLFVVFFSDVEAGQPGRTRDLLGAAVLLGLAGLTKYNAAFLGFAVIGTVLVRARLRPLLGDWRLYLAGALTIALQAPTLIWNLEHGFASFAFHTSGRFEGAAFEGLDIGRMRAVVLDTMGVLSPFVVPAIVSFFLRQQRGSFERVGKTIAIWTFWLSSALFLYIANFYWVVWWWNIVAFAPIFLFLGRYIGGYALSLHLVWGLVANSAMLLSYAIFPLTLLVGMKPLAETTTTHNWDQIAATVRAYQDEHGAEFFATNRYQLSSPLAFALDDPDVAELSPRRTAFDDWFDYDAHLGQSAIVLVERRDDTRYWRTLFTNVTELGPLDVVKFGRRLHGYEVFFAEGFLGQP